MYVNGGFELANSLFEIAYLEISYNRSNKIIYDLIKSPMYLITGSCDEVTYQLSYGSVFRYHH